MDSMKQCFEGDAKDDFAAVRTVWDINCPQVQYWFKKIQGRVVDERMMFVKSPSFV